MLQDITSAEYVEGYKLKIEFENGLSGVVDFSDYTQRGGVFENFKDLAFFRQFTISKELGTIVWNGEVDIAPETIYKKCEHNASCNQLSAIAPS